MREPLADPTIHVFPPVNEKNEPIFVDLPNVSCVNVTVFSGPRRFAQAVASTLAFSRTVRDGFADVSGSIGRTIGLPNLSGLPSLGEPAVG